MVVCWSWSLWREGSYLSRAQAKTEGRGKGVHSGSLLEEILRQRRLRCMSHKVRSALRYLGFGARNGGCASGRSPGALYSLRSQTSNGSVRACAKTVPCPCCPPGLVGSMLSRRKRIGACQLHGRTAGVGATDRMSVTLSKYLPAQRMLTSGKRK